KEPCMDTDDYRKFVTDKLIETLSEIQNNAGRELPAITEATVPLEDLPGFDSLNAVESSVLLSEKVATEIDETVFFAKRIHQPTVREIVDSILQKHGNEIFRRLRQTEESVEL